MLESPLSRVLLILLYNYCESSLSIEGCRKVEIWKIRDCTVQEKTE